MLFKPTLQQFRKGIRISGKRQSYFALQIDCNAAYLSQFLNGKRKSLHIANELRRCLERKGIYLARDGISVFEGAPTIDSNEAINNEKRQTETRRTQNKLTVFKFQQSSKKAKSECLTR